MPISRRSRGDAVLVAPPVLVKVEAPAVVFYLDPVLLDPRRAIGFKPRSFAESAPRPAEFRFVARAPAPGEMAENAAPQPVVRTVRSVPLPTPRPADLGLLTQRSQRAAHSSDDPFEKLFGKPETTGSILAYAAPLGAARRRRRGRPARPFARPHAGQRRADRDLRHHGAHGLSAGRHQARSAFRARPEDGRSAPRECEDARRDAAACLRPDPARGAVPRRAGAAADPGRRSGSDLRAHRPARPTPICSARAATRTAASRSRTTTRSCRPTRPAR